MLPRVIAIITLCALWAFAPRLSSAEEAVDDEATRLFDLANGLYIRGPAFYGQAVIQYREFLNRYPTDKRCDLATFFLANCLRRQGKNEEALRFFLDHQKFKGSPKRDEANFRTGQVYFALDKYPEAIPYFLKVDGQKVDENLATSSIFWLGRAYLKNNQSKEAIAALLKVADGKENPLAPWANFYLGYAYRDAEDFNKVIERFQKAAASLPERRDEALFMMAEAYAKLEKYSSAYAAYKELVEKHRESAFRGRAAFAAVWSLYSAKDYQNAIAAYEICQKFITPDSRAEAAYIAANCYYETNKLGEALQAYQKVSRDFPKTPFAPRAEYKACWCLFLQDRFDEVIASGKTFVKNYPSYPEISNIHFAVGESLYERNRIGEALSQYDTVVTQYPQCPFREKASFKLGVCYLKANSPEKARKTFRDFVTTYPTSELAPKALARAAESGLELARKAKPELQPAQYEEVARDYQALIEKYPKDELAGETLYQLGVTYARLDKHEDMIKTFEKLIKTYPKNQNCAEAYYWLASESEKAKEYDQAVDYFERSLQLKPKGPYSEQAKRRLVDVYYKKDDKEKAANLIVEMLRSDPQSQVPEQTHLWAGEFLLEKGKYDEAIEVYNLFLTKFKGSPFLEGAYYGLGDCYFKQEKWEQAIRNFTRAMEFKGQPVSQSRLYSGIAHLKLGRNKEGQELLREVERSADSELAAKAVYWIGNMNFELARAMKPGKEKIAQYNLARREYIKVVILYTKSELRPECMYRVAECLEQEGLIEDSKKQLQELIENYREDEFAKRAREKLGMTPTVGAGQ